MSEEPRSAWLIENGKQQGSGLKYQFYNTDIGRFDWTEDVHEALQFSRRKDAEAIAHDSDDAWRIVEHGFHSPPSEHLELLRECLLFAEDVYFHGEQSESVRSGSLKDKLTSAIEKAKQ